jgi:hypothetical protein
MHIFDNFVQVSNAPPPPKCTCSNNLKSTHAHVINGFHQNVIPNNLNTPLILIIISKPNAQHTLINTLNIQVNPFFNPTNIVVDDIMDITLDTMCAHI